MCIVIQIFFSLRQIEQKMKYSLWKVADIRKALKEGRKPEPGPPGGDPDLPVKADTMTNTNVCFIFL